MRRWLPLVVFGVALVVRLAHVIDLTGNPFFNHPVIDAAEYDEWARAIQGGDFLSRAKGAFWQPPFYPYFLGSVYFLVGGSYVVTRVVQAILGAGSAFFVFCLGRRFAGDKVGLVAGLGTALYWPLVFFDAEFLPVGLLVFLDLLTILLLLQAADKGDIPHWLLAGLVMGLAIITRPTSLLLVPLIIVWLWFERERIGGKKVANAAGAILLMVAVLVGLVTWRNHAIGGEAVLVSSNGGLNFYVGNNSDYDRTVEIRPGARWSELLLKGPVGPGVTSSDRSNHFLTEGLRWIGGNPGAAVALYAKKFYLFWNNHEIRRNQDLYFFRRYSHFVGPPLLGFAMVAPLAVLGMVVTLRRWRKFLLLYLVFLGHLAGVLLFFVCARYRLPALPYMMIFAALGLWWMVDAVREKRVAAIVGGVAVCAVVLAASLSDVYGTAHPAFAREYYELGRVEEDARNFPQAEKWYRAAIEVDAADPDFYVHLAMAELSQKKTEDAERTLEKTLEIMPGCGDAYYILGAIYQQRGDLSEAENAYRQAMRLNPLGAKPEAYARLASVYLDQGKLAEAEAAVNEALRRDPDFPEARIVRAQLNLRAGKVQPALLDVRRVLEKDPSHLAARILLQSIIASQKSSQGETAP